LQEIIKDPTSLPFPDVLWAESPTSSDKISGVNLLPQQYSMTTLERNTMVSNFIEAISPESILYR
jgi:hypothetical protein